MSERRKRGLHKQGFLQGAAILAIGTVLAKGIGALFKIPLARIITTEGAGHFFVAYNLYLMLLNITSAGLPIAVSRLISEANTLGQQEYVRKIHRISLGLFLTLGGVCGGAMLLGAAPLARWMNDPDAVYAIAVLAPAVLFVCVGSAFRGYFQGQQYMTPTATAQVLEALCKLLIGLAAAAAAIRLGLGYPRAAGAAILGVTVGSVLSSVYFVLHYRANRRPLSPADSSAPVPNAAQILRRIVWLAVPITVSATGLQIFNTLSSKVILGQLQDRLGMSAEGASALFGILSMAQTLYLLPSALVQPLTASIIPAVTEALAGQNRQDATRKEESALRICALIAMPCGVGLSVLSGPIQQLLYGYDAAVLETAEPILALLGLAATLYCFILVTNSILQVHEKAWIPIFSTLAGGTANLAAVYFLVGIPQIHILGAAVGVIIYCAVALVLNLLAISRLPHAPRFLPQTVKPLLAAAVMGVAARGIYGLFPSTLVAVAAACAVYFVLVYRLKILTWYDCRLLPKGDLIAGFLGIEKTSDKE